jgi:hypothetical protein
VARLIETSWRPCICAEAELITLIYITIIKNQSYLLFYYIRYLDVFLSYYSYFCISIFCCIRSGIMVVYKLIFSILD